MRKSATKMSFRRHKSHIFADMKNSKPLCNAKTTYMGYPLEHALQRDKSQEMPESFCRNCVKAMRKLEGQKC